MTGRIAESRNQVILPLNTAETNAHDPALAYLSTVKFGVKIEREIGNLNRHSQEADGDLETIRALLDAASANRTKVVSGHSGKWRMWLNGLYYGLKHSMKRSGINRS
jgi:hypothetical protein